VCKLDSDTEDELDPDAPLPWQVLLDKPANDGTKDGSTNRRKDNECHGVLLVIRLEDIGDHAQGDRPTSRGQTTEGASNEDGAEVRGESDGNIPEVDEEETELENGSPTEL
jgi:hypothetical protein